MKSIAVIGAGMHQVHVVLASDDENGLSGISQVAIAHDVDRSISGTPGANHVPDRSVSEVVRDAAGTPVE